MTKIISKFKKIHASLLETGDTFMWNGDFYVLVSEEEYNGKQRIRRLATVGMEDQMLFYPDVVEIDLDVNETVQKVIFTWLFE